MENKRPDFAIQDHSALSLVTELHAYFRDLQSFYKISRGLLLSELESNTDENKVASLHQSIEEVNRKLTFFHVINNSISTVDTVLHTDTMIDEFKSN